MKPVIHYNEDISHRSILLIYLSPIRFISTLKNCLLLLYYIIFHLTAKKNTPSSFSLTFLSLALLWLPVRTLHAAIRANKQETGLNGAPWILDIIRMIHHCAWPINELHSFSSTHMSCFSSFHDLAEKSNTDTHAAFMSCGRTASWKRSCVVIQFIR